MSLCLRQVRVVVLSPTSRPHPSPTSYPYPSPSHRSLASLSLSTLAIPRPRPRLLPEPSSRSQCCPSPSYPYVPHLSLLFLSEIPSHFSQPPPPPIPCTHHTSLPSSSPARCGTWTSARCSGDEASPPQVPLARLDMPPPPPESAHIQAHRTPLNRRHTWCCVHLPLVLRACLRGPPPRVVVCFVGAGGVNIKYGCLQDQIHTVLRCCLLFAIRTCSRRGSVGGGGATDYV